MNRVSFSDVNSYYYFFFFSSVASVLGGVSREGQGQGQTAYTTNTDRITHIRQLDSYLSPSKPLHIYCHVVTGWSYFDRNLSRGRSMHNNFRIHRDYGQSDNAPRLWRI